MTEEAIEKIDAANIADALKNKLKELARGVETLMPDLPRVTGYYVEFYLAQIISEATDKKPETLWWEAALDLLSKATAEQGETGRALAEIAGELALLLRARFGPDGDVTLEQITAETVRGICLLSDTLTEPRKAYVAPNAISLAQAHFEPHAWFRAIYAGKTPVGFIMIVDNDEEQQYFIWRLMIGEPYQGRGYGRQAIQRLVEYVETRPGATELLVSCGQGVGSPEPFYEKLGFVNTGDKMGHEVVLRLELPLATDSRMDS